MGVTGLQAVSVTDLYFLQGTLNGEAVQSLINILLYDPVVEQATWQLLDTSGKYPPAVGGQPSAVIEVTLLPGVTDSVAESLLQGAQMIGLAGLEQAASGQRYTFTGPIEEQAAQRIAARLLANEVSVRLR